MRMITINGNRMTSMEEAHLHLKKTCRFPDYYGKNLDALYDMLSTEDRNTLLLFFDSRGVVKQLGLRGERLVETFQDAALANQRIRLIRVERKGRQLKGFVV